MNKKSSYCVLYERFAPGRALAWACLGVLIALTAGFWGQSSLPVHALGFGSGFGAWLVGITLFVAVMAALALVPGRTGKHGRGDFENFHSWALAGTSRAASVLLGFSVCALVWWLFAQAAAALASSFLAFLLSASLWYCWACIAVLAQHFEQS